MALFCFTLLVWPPVYTSLEYFILLTLELVLILVLKLADFVFIQLHRPIAGLEGFWLFFRGFCGSLAHLAQFPLVFVVLVEF
jgi:hypothetical protein